MSKTDQTAGDVFDSLTGFDEMSITQHFGRSIGDLTDDSSMWARALVFTVKRRGDLNDDDARNEAMSMTLKDVTSYFAEEPDEASEAGKDEPVSEPQQQPPVGTSLSSVS